MLFLYTSLSKQLNIQYCYLLVNQMGTISLASLPVYAAAYFQRMEEGQVEYVCPLVSFAIVFIPEDDITDHSL